MLGVIAGQLINAWREDRRWKREQAREDLRWQREREKDKSQRDHEKHVHWMEKKYEVYSRILTLTKLAGPIYRAFEESLSTNPPNQDPIKEFKDTHQETIRLMSEIGLLGSTAATMSAMDLLSYFYSMYADLDKAASESNLPTWDDYSEKIQELVVRESTFRFVAMKELGLEDPNQSVDSDDLDQAGVREQVKELLGFLIDDPDAYLESIEKKFKAYGLTDASTTAESNSKAQ